MNYKNINDYELLYLIEDENDNYKNIIYDKYDYLIKKLCNKYINICNNDIIDKEDLYQEALLGLEYAINNFNTCKNIKFYTYCYLCIKSKITDYLTRALTNKNLIFKNTISLYTQVCDGTYLYEIIPANINVYNDIIIADKIRNIINFKNSLNNTASQVFELRMNGFSNKEISTLLSIDIKKVYSCIVCIKSKYKKCKYLS